MKNLQKCYETLSEILGPEIEPYQSVELVEQYRRYWKPDNVRIILLAESHVFTTDSDREFSLHTTEELSEYPSQYAKFVYCLAYGESSLTKGNVHPAVDGTPQFWKLFYSCVNKVRSNNDFAPILKSRTSTEQRIQNKINVLKEMRERGVWLVDTSIMALYNRGKKPANNVMTQALRTSWLGYTRHVIQEAAPEHVIVIGKGVVKSIESELQEDIGHNYTVMYQPNARLSAEQLLESYKTYYRLCQK